jgi:hypothetical protein
MYRLSAIAPVMKIGAWTAVVDQPVDDRERIADATSHVEGQRDLVGGPREGRAGSRFEDEQVVGAQTVRKLILSSESDPRPRFSDHLADVSAGRNRHYPGHGQVRSRRPDDYVRRLRARLRIHGRAAALPSWHGLRRSIALCGLPGDATGTLSPRTPTTAVEPRKLRADARAVAPARTGSTRDRHGRGL